MEPCTLAEIESAFNATVADVAPRHGVDPICSSSHWAIPVADAFSPNSRHRVFSGDAGHLALLEINTPGGNLLSSFDCVWGFTTPLVGRDPVTLVTDVERVLKGLRFDLLTLSGLDPSGPLFDEVQRLGPVGYTDTADRCIVDLSAGFDAWLDRRSSRFRRSLRAASSRGEARGISVEHLAPVGEADLDECFRRLLSIEKASWKSDIGSGLSDTKLGRFTRDMAERFARLASLRVQFARLDGEDIGYVIGARVADRYRGFQHSFDQRFQDLSVGKFLQYNAILALASEGVTSYDMGMHMSYKESYADRIESTTTAVIQKR